MPSFDDFDLLQHALFIIYFDIGHVMPLVKHE